MLHGNGDHTIIVDRSAVGGISHIAVVPDGLVGGIKLFAIAMKVVDTLFIHYPEENEETAGHAQGQAKDIDGGVSFVTDKITPGDSEIAFQHRKVFVLILSGAL